jgi:signal transduction histidine kinase
MAQLIDDLLGYAKLGRRALGTSAVSLDEVLTHLKSELSQRLREEGGQLHIAKDLPVVNGDPTLLGQVFSNLIQNALTYRAADRPAQVTVDWERSANSVLVHVRDHGIGIAPEHLEKIFNVFQRLHSDEEFAGTGIGLAVVHKALKLLGGSIQVSSEPGNGSVFSVKLPAPPAATE